MKTFAAPVAVIALLLSVTPATAEDAPVKVDPKKIEKLTPENAPKPSLSDKLLSAVRSDPGSAKAIDPTTAPQLKAPPKPADDMPPVNVKPKPFVAEEAPKTQSPSASTNEAPKPVKINADKPVEVKGEKLSDKKLGVVKVEGKPAPESVEKGKAETKDAVKKMDVPQEKAPVTAEEAMAKVKPAEKTGIGKYLPW